MFLSKYLSHMMRIGKIPLVKDNRILYLVNFKICFISVDELCVRLEGKYGNLPLYMSF